MSSTLLWSSNVFGHGSIMKKRAVSSAIIIIIIIIKNLRGSKLVLLDVMLSVSGRNIVLL